MADRHVNIGGTNFRGVDRGDGSFDLGVVYQVQAPTITIVAAPVLTVHATYANGDYVGTSLAPWEFPGAARAAGRGGQIVSASLLDKVGASVNCELWLFSRKITVPADSAAWSVSDADMAYLIPGGVIPFSTYYASAANSVASGVFQTIQYTLDLGTILYGALVTRGAPAWIATGDVAVSLGIVLY